MGTPLYLCQDGIDIQHAVRNLSQWMANPTKLALKGVKHVVLYPKVTDSYGLLPPYQISNNSKLDELYGRDSNGRLTKMVVAFSDSDWAVSARTILLNGRMVTSWGSTQISIALWSCKREYFASAGAAEALYVGRLWEFMTINETSIYVITDPSSGKPFSRCLGVGRFKHVDLKHLWRQKTLKDRLLQMETRTNFMNVSDIGAQKLNTVRRLFLMFLIGMIGLTMTFANLCPWETKNLINICKEKCWEKT